MMEKKLILFIMVLLILNISLISSIDSIEYPQCCVLAYGGSQCVSVMPNECASNYAPTSCDNVEVCKKGVCVDISSGQCTENTPKAVCDSSGGLFKDEEIHNIPECQRGCCILGGEEYLFASEIACQETASDFGIDFTFRADIKTSNACLGLTSAEEEGACVIKTDFETKCKRTLGNNCIQESSGGLVGLLENYVSGAGVILEFHPGMLCTADELGADCVKTQKTTCFKDDVYYLDSCGNKANVFNSVKYDAPSDSDYWTYIQEPLEVCGAVVGGANEAKTCGNCDYYSSSKCREPQSNDLNVLKQQNGYEHVCGDLSCEYNGNIYENTESWCAETPATPWATGGPGIKLNLTGELITNKDELFKPMEYNLPGSRYVVQECYEGEILNVECKDQREQVCKQVEQEERTRAYCEVNNYRSCLLTRTKDKCNAIDDCYWLSGDSPIIGGHEDEGADYNLSRFPDDEREQKQGSCVPLFAPGQDFWTEVGQAYCMSTGDYPRNVVYSIALVRDRKDFGEDSETTGEMWSYDESKRQSRCIANCFAIPNYGGATGEYQDNLATLWNGDDWNFDWGEGKKPVSDRKGYYCHKKDEPDSPKSGQVVGSTIDCAEDESERYDKPEFYTHLIWLKFTGLRSRASGDCGITANFQGNDPSYDSEKITTVVQKVEQDITTVKQDLTEGILYKGEDLADLNAPKFNGQIYEGTSAEVV